MSYSGGDPVNGRPDWRDMPRDAFDDTAATVQLALLPKPDPCGTGDLFADDGPDQ